MCVSKTIFLFIFQKTNGEIETTFYFILIPGDHPGEDDGDDEMSSRYVTSHRFYKESKYFGLLASVFSSHAVYLVRKVFSKVITSLLCVSKITFLFVF